MFLLIIPYKAFSFDIDLQCTLLGAPVHLLIYLCFPIITIQTNHANTGRASVNVHIKPHLSMHKDKGDKGTKAKVLKTTFS